MTDDSTEDERAPTRHPDTSNAVPADSNKTASSLRFGLPAGFISKSVLPDLTRLLGPREALAKFTSAAVIRSGALNSFSRSTAFQNLSLPTLGLTDAFAKATLGPSMLSASLASQMAGVRVSSLVKDIKLNAFARPELFAPQLKSIALTASFVEDQNRALAALRPEIRIVRAAVFASESWNDLVRVSSPTPSAALLSRLEVGGRGTGWTLNAGMTLAVSAEEQRRSLQVQAEATLGPAEASAELRLRLHEVHPSLCERLDGAWERITAGGKDAASQAANSLIETVDWTLRTLAPDPEVLRWHASEARPAKELHEGKPTRALRLRFAVRDQPDKSKALDLYLKALTALVSAVQSPKHAIDLQAPKALVPVALSVEGLLHLLVVG
ncbi:MAG: hypothetical protein QOK28_104 [Actinomycetota bacterium]